MSDLRVVLETSFRMEGRRWRDPKGEFLEFREGVSIVIFLLIKEEGKGS